MASATRQWHIGDYGTLGWVETGLKTLAVLIGLSTGIAALQTGSLAFPEGTQAIQLIVLGFMALLLTLAIADRVIDREIIAMVFIIFNVLSHWGMVLGLATPGLIEGRLVPFCVFMIAGDIVKIIFFATTGFQIRDIPRNVIFGLTGGSILTYVIVLVLQLLS